MWLFNIVSQHTVYGMFLLTQNLQKSLLSASGLQEQKTTDLLRSSPHCLKAALTLPPWCLVGKSYSGIAHLPSNPVNTTLHPKRVNSKWSHSLLITFCINNFILTILQSSPKKAVFKNGIAYHLVMWRHFPSLLPITCCISASSKPG